jgi:aerobic C4-dicarboxylate transport protein
LRAGFFKKMFTSWVVLGFDIARMASFSSRVPWYRILYVQVLIGVAMGIMLGWWFPEQAKALKALGDGFIRLVKMMISPIIFCTVVHGVASMGDLKKLGRIGGKTLLYFEVVSTVALIVGLVVVNLLQPGAGFHARLDATGGADALKGLTEKAEHLSAMDFLLNIIPTSFLGAFIGGDLLQVLFISLITAFALAGMGAQGRPALAVIEQAGEVFFKIMGLLVKAAPVGAFGAMAYTVASYGIGSLGRLVSLMLGFYLTSGLFVLVVLGSIARACGFSILRYLRYIREELLLVLGTSSSETALPALIQKLRGLGCAPATVGLVVPTGYSFNLDGTNIYMTMAAVFLAQATDTPLDLGQQLSLLFVAMITSKGASGVTGAGFVTLAATLAVVPAIPVESLALIVGIDRFMSECRALTNFIGNGVAAIAISRWEGEVTPAMLEAGLREPTQRTEPR